VYRREGINPASGCLPVLIQIPIIWSLYNVLTTILRENGQEALNHLNSVVYFDFLKITAAWDPTFFGMPLSVIPRDVFSSQPLYILVAVVTAASQLLLSRMMMPASAPVKKARKSKNGPDD